MRFTLKSLGSKYLSSECFYELHSEQAIFYSPVYPDESSALIAMEALVLRLRDRKKTRVAILKRNASYAIELFGKDVPVVRPSTAFTDKISAIEIFEKILHAAKEDSFPLSFMELPAAQPEIQELGDLNLQAGMDTYPWVEVNTSTLRIGIKERGDATLMGLPLEVSPWIEEKLVSTLGPCAPLFDLLQPQEEDDLPLFMGREESVEDLHGLMSNQRLLLLYGQDRVGKTSLIQCGLANRIEAMPGQLVVHRRGEEGIIPSFQERLRTEITKLTKGPAPATEDSTLTLLANLQEQVAKPVFIVFDQLEELFDPEVTEEERDEFFDLIHQLTTDNTLPYRVILSLREKFLAPLAEYEEQLPAMLTHRYRVQALSKASMVEASESLLELFDSEDKMSVDQPELVADRLCSELVDGKGEVSFQCMQIYMQELHQASCAEAAGEIPVFDVALIDRIGSGREVINQYINREISQLQGLLQQGDSAGTAAAVVEKKIENLEESRQHCGCGETRAVAPVAAAGAAGVVSNRSRNLRWLLLIALLALLFGALAYWLLSCWSNRQDPCFMTQQAGTCEAYVNYLNEYGETAACAAEFRDLLAEKQCAVWEDYQMLQQTKTCGAYQAFFLKYRNTNVSTAHVQRMLLEWQCPLVRDTVEVTVRDTFFDRTPTDYNTTGTLPNRISGASRSGSNPPCQDFNGENFKQVGPLWFMTDPLAGGPYTWEDALTACSAKGWRLPCIGEVDYLIDNIYRGQKDRAYQMLTGSGECYLLDPAKTSSRRIDFWTGTEANDASAWTFYFDTQTKTIGKESNIIKGRQLPCLCVKKEAQRGSGLPPCYNKTVNRE